MGRRRLVGAVVAVSVRPRNTHVVKTPPPPSQGGGVVDGLRTQVCGQQILSNDPCNNQHNPHYAND